MRFSGEGAIPPGGVSGASAVPPLVAPLAVLSDRPADAVSSPGMGGQRRSSTGLKIEGEPTQCQKPI
jgi:hypothetical protein